MTKIIIMKTNLIFASCLILLITFNSKSQNIANNGGFEIYSVLPNTYNEIDQASGWSNCNGNYVTQGNWGSPDYLSLLGSGVALLPCGYLGCVNPRTGNGIAGMITYNGFSPNFREYIRTFLTTPMVVGKTYSVSLYLTIGTSPISKWVSNNMGILFSKDSTWQVTLNNVLPRTPQININTIIDSAGWKKYSFLYVADSAYKYITLGNFYSDAGTTLQVINPGSGQLYTYYRLDDISVVMAAQNGIEEINAPQNTISVVPNPNNGEFVITGKQNELISITNELGQVIQMHQLNFGNNYSAKINNLSVGIYFAVGQYSKNKIVVLK